MMLRALDLYCGKGGWASGFIAEGFQIIGVDLNDFSEFYPGVFVQADLLKWEGWRDLRGIVAVVSSPPCEEFSRWSMPWTRAKNPPPPREDLWRRGEFIAAQLGVPCVTENVRGAQPFMGRSSGHCGPFHLWGSVPAILPPFHGRKKESFGSKQKADRAVIYEPLARHIARCFKH